MDLKELNTSLRNREAVNFRQIKQDANGVATFRERPYGDDDNRGLEALAQVSFSARQPTGKTPAKVVIRGVVPNEYANPKTGVTQYNPSRFELSLIHSVGSNRLDRKALVGFVQGLLGSTELVDVLVDGEAVV